MAERDEWQDSTPVSLEVKKTIFQKVGQGDPAPTEEENENAI